MSGDSQPHAPQFPYANIRYALQHFKNRRRPPQGAAEEADRAIQSSLEPGTFQGYVMDVGLEFFVLASFEHGSPKQETIKTLLPGGGGQVGILLVRPTGNEANALTRRTHRGFTTAQR